MFAGHILALYNQMFTGGALEGLGLTLVKRIIDLSGGAITVQSAPDKGALFTVSLAVH